MLVTNQLQYARPADRILYLSDGRVVEAGTYDELMERGGGFAQLMQQTEVHVFCISGVVGPCFCAKGLLEPSAQSHRVPSSSGRCTLACNRHCCHTVITGQPAHHLALGHPAEPMATGLPACSTCFWAQHPVCMASRCLRRLQNSRPCSFCTSSGTRPAPPAHPLRPPATCPLTSLCADLLMPLQRPAMLQGVLSKALHRPTTRPLTELPTYIEYLQAVIRRCRYVHDGCPY